MKIVNDLKQLNHKVVHGTSFGWLSIAYIVSVIALSLTVGGFIPYWSAIIIITCSIALLELLSVKDQVEIVHGLVNHQRDDLLAFNTLLKEVIVAGGLDVPNDPSQTTEGEK